ncbi:MAG: hypothetical protein IJD92_05415 [Bacilli bacterium]|nr:hypothetical protein [Bacilli bacterium]
MGNSSFLNRLIIFLVVLVLLVIVVFFMMNKNNVQANLDEVELITSMNVNTYDEDLYIYKLENNKIYASEFYYNKFYLDNNDIELNEYTLNGDTKFYLKNLSNSISDINDIKITYDPITLNQFKYILDNYSMLKIYIWFNKDDTTRNVLLYTNNNIDIELENY